MHYPPAREEAAASKPPTRTGGSDVPHSLTTPQMEGTIAKFSSDRDEGIEVADGTGQQPRLFASAVGRWDCDQKVVWVQGCKVDLKKTEMTALGPADEAAAAAASELMTVDGMVADRRSSRIVDNILMKIAEDLVKSDDDYLA
mmetsp:Transcript_54589/g.119692  ORF Transcript_54589/g.119692 Transcript_54589/m.119692 type:complete len:143 (+) Transcript_54589:43-471(+)